MKSMRPEDEVYIVGGIFGGLFVLSEVLGMSKCKANGVIQFIFPNSCLGHEVNISVGVREPLLEG